MNYTTQSNMLVWCEETIEKADASSLKTAAEHLLVECEQQRRIIEKLEYLRSRLVELRRRLRPDCEAPRWVIEAIDRILSLTPEERNADMTTTRTDQVEIPPDHIMQFFKYDHLPPALRVISSPFCELAFELERTLPRNPERTVTLRKLLEAKDAAVRAYLAK